MIVRELVLPSPGGPTSRTWSSASPRAFAAVERDRELLLDALLADEVVEPARPQRALDSSSSASRAAGARNCARLTPPASAPARTRSSAGSSGSTRRAPARPRRASSRARRARRARRAARRRRRAGVGDRSRRPSFSFSSSTIRSRRLLADPGDRLEARRVLEHDRAPELGRRRARRRSRARPSARRRSRRAAARRARARPRRRSRRAGARPRGRAGRSRP